MDEDLHGLIDATLLPGEWIRTSRVSGSIPPLYSESLSLAAGSQHVSALVDVQPGSCRNWPDAVRVDTLYSCAIRSFRAISY